MINDLFVTDTNLWSPQQDKAFIEVKKLVVSHAVHKYYDIIQEVMVQCDASERGLSATLLHIGQPVVFAFRTLTAFE